MNKDQKTYQKVVQAAREAEGKASGASKVSEAAAYARLISEARQAADNAYAPYSNFPVGAALLAEDGRVFTGCNVEICTFDGGLCAERVAFVKAISEGVRSFKAIAVFCRRSIGSWPCGLCRQFMAEFAIDLDVIEEAPGGGFQTLKLKELLPRHFGPADLQK